MSPTCISSEDCESGPFFEKFNNSDDYESGWAAATDLFSMFINPLEVDFFFEYVPSIMFMNYYRLTCHSEQLYTLHRAR